MKENKTQNSRLGGKKTLAMIIFLIIIALLAWTAIRLVENSPTAFNWLVNTIKNEPSSESLVINQSDDSINSNQPIEISWNSLENPGSYAFSYFCQDGVSLNILSSDDNPETLICDQIIEIDGDQTTLTLLVKNTNPEPTEVNYILGFRTDNNTNLKYQTEKSFEVLNQEPAEIEEVAPPANETPINYYSDLALKAIVTGHLNNQRQFTSSQTIDRDKQGAIRFSVQNIGNKTSEPWSYITDLPNGEVYKSEVQAPLLPGQYDIVTIGFTNIKRLGTKRHGLAIKTNHDSNLSNNGFFWHSTIVD